MFFPCCSLDDGVATLSWFPPAWLVQLYFLPLWPIILVNVERKKTHVFIVNLCMNLWSISNLHSFRWIRYACLLSPFWRSFLAQMKDWNWRYTFSTLSGLPHVHSRMLCCGLATGKLAWPLVNWLGHLCNLCLWQPVIALGLAFDVLCAHGAGYSFGARQDVYTRSAWKSASSVYIYMLCLDV